MKKLLQLVLFLTVNVTIAQIEINPASLNAELDLKSQTKGMLLPRINKPADVNSLQEALLFTTKNQKLLPFMMVVTAE